MNKNMNVSVSPIQIINMKVNESMSLVVSVIVSVSMSRCVYISFCASPIHGNRLV